MKTVKLNDYDKSKFPDQNLSIKVIDTSPLNVIASSESYPSSQTLPATFNLSPHPQVHLYKDKNITVQLWGDVSGLMGYSTIDMKEYKIIYPIDMETKEGSTSFSVAGTWQ
ncbi:hypothetical protein [uncultured Cytophaga sp.]|uniref:hypothetical protein n=1 Tax=uncultured Cytophaga sp. TaxID=160238 RepID=UPI002624BB34|nr:hypothetical protein [uncultured Cytophaga sp.]